MADLLRNLKTEVVHRPDCPSKGGNVTTWNRARGRSMNQIIEDSCQFPWLHLCMVCMPGLCRCGKCRDLFGEADRG